MPTVLIFSENTLCASKVLAGDAQLPFVESMRFTAADFAGRSRSPLLWTERGALTALDALSRLAGVPFAVDYAFRRSGECGHSLDSRHLTGCAFDVGRSLAPAQRRSLRALALNWAGFCVSAPACLSGYCLHLGWGEARPALSNGDCRAAVCVLQDALRIGDFFSGAISGCFDAETRRAVLRMQRACGFAETGDVRGREWARAEALLAGHGGRETDEAVDKRVEE